MSIPRFCDGTHLWVIYDHPKDFPEHYIARRHAIEPDCHGPTTDVMIADELNTLRAELLAHGFVCKTFDCRHFAWMVHKSTTRKERQRIRGLERQVVNRGRKLMATMTATLSEIMTAPTYVTKIK